MKISSELVEVKKKYIKVHNSGVFFKQILDDFYSFKDKKWVPLRYTIINIDLFINTCFRN